MPDPAARWTLIAALAYTLFPVYGSLIPFHWTPLPLASAGAQFMALLAEPIGPISRADFAANVLLAAPFTLLWMAVAAGRLRRPVSLITAAALVWLAGVALAFGLEFAQIFFSGRRPALSDILAQSIGAAIGIAGWRMVPRAFWMAGRSDAARRQRILALYLVGLILYALLPLDLTVSLSEIAGKWHAGRIRLLPFQGWADAPLDMAGGFVANVAIWALAAALARRAAPERMFSFAIGLVLLAALLEAMQVLVLSRVTASTDIIAAALGVALMQRSGPFWAAGQAGGRRWRFLLPAAVGMAIVVVNIWPMEPLRDAGALKLRLQALTLLPFAGYVANTELYLVTNVLRRMAAYGGFALACLWAMSGCRGRRTSRMLGVGACTAMLAALVEGLQVFLPGKVVDLGDVIIAALIGALAAALWPVAQVVSPLPARTVRTAPAAPDPRRALQSDAVLRGWAASAAALILLTFVVLPHLPGLPYNLRELLGSDGGPWAGAAVTVAALLFFASPAYLARAALPTRTVPWLATAAGLIGLPALLALLLYLGAPRESVLDIVGSPVLHRADTAESLGRLSVLLAGPLWALALGHALQGTAMWPAPRTGAAVHLLLHGLWLVPAWHLVVVVWAGTDNLVELMAGGGGPASTASLLAYGVLVGTTGGVLAGALCRRGARRWVGAALALVVSALPGWWLLSLGTEAMLVKYGKVFSALQFLLSTDRDHYVGAEALMLRFAAAHLAVSMLAAVGVLLACAWPLQRVRSLNSTSVV
ncbi:MAG: VanZ family protein [Rubrivivax sp.]|nr:VanZ family protein [Rubrivivax sp.]